MSAAVQLEFIPAETPEAIITRAEVENRPIARVALFSGGHDSTVLAHYCQEAYESLAFIDTGTALPGVRDFVIEFAHWLGKPLTILESGDAYRRLVLGLRDTPAPPGWRPYGFPGPAGHNRTYAQLKERQLRRLRARLQDGHPPRDRRVLMLSGVRRSESIRRRSRPAVSRHGAIVFANPLIGWSAGMMAEYRQAHHLPESDVAALLHRSGECNCGCFAGPGEREDLEQLWPEWFRRTIGDLESEAQALGIRAARWGARPRIAPTVDAGPLCSDCQLRWELA